MKPTKEYLETLPHTPGIYIYRDAQGVILYVGKAVDLYNRVRQYFQRDDAIGDKTVHLVSQITDIETIQTVSEFDALLLEAQLIKEHLPKYNSIAKDDKSPIYIWISTHDELPYVRVVRKTHIPTSAWKKDEIFGPFQSARVVRSMLKRLRFIVPYCTQAQRTGKPCFYTHIGLCHPCPSVIYKMPEGETRKEQVQQYRKQIFRLCDLLRGKSSSVIKTLEKEMNQLAYHEAFEQAQKVKLQIDQLHSLLELHYDPNVYLETEYGANNLYTRELEELRTVLIPYFPNIEHLSRIECIDISNFQGTHAVGSLVVLKEGKADPSSYRRFRIRGKNTPNDFRMIHEVLTRRMKHLEWPKPQLLVIDGGKGQLSMAKRVLEDIAPLQPVIGLAKRYEEIVIQEEKGYKIIRIPFTSGALHVLQRVRDEAHRFAITYHKLLRKKAMNITS